MSPPKLPIVLAVAGLFLVWSNSFVAIGYLLGSDVSAARFDWIGLTVARFVPAAVLCAAYCTLRRREALGAIRSDWPRLVLCGALAVPGYNLALYYGQEHGVPAPIAALTTALLPLFVMLLAAAFLGERLTARRLAGFAVAASGMIVVALARRGETRAYTLAIAVTVLAPLSWSLFSVLSKRPSARIRPLLWTYLSVVFGTLMLAPMLPHTWSQWRVLDAPGWASLLYLSIPCTVAGFAVWIWLLKHLPASSVGFTVFLNPPLATLSKVALAALFPATFLFHVNLQEYAGGALALLGLFVAVSASRPPQPVPPQASSR
jgi:drug/metabolite transporter (DMT)-like permease